jgi:opacity protein-like surface antigen
MKRVIIICLTLVFGVIGGVAMPVFMAEAQQSDRGGSWEFSLPIIYTDSTTIDFTKGSSVDLNSDWGMGLGLGYNINNHFQINGLFSFSTRSYEASFIEDNDNHTTGKYNGYLDSTTIALNGVYYFLSSNITPFVSGGIGMTYIDTNIPSGVGSSYCYWDPWWGYVCGTYVPTKTENDFSYTAGLGVRWDVNDSAALQGSYNKLWLDISEADGGMPDLDLFKIDFILRL